MIGALPKSVTASGKEYGIRTDYRNILQAFEVFEDDELDEEGKLVVIIYLFFPDFPDREKVYEAVRNGFDIKEAVERIWDFIFAEKTKQNKETLPVYDWKQDEQMIFSSVNKVAGKEVREVPYMHWWTFLGFFNEVGKGTFLNIVNIRQKLNDGKRLEKWEWEFLNKNSDVVLLRGKEKKERFTEEEKRAIDEHDEIVRRQKELRAIKFAREHAGK